MRGTRRWRSCFMIRYLLEELSRQLYSSFIPVDAPIAGGVAL